MIKIPVANKSQEVGVFFIGAYSIHLLKELIKNWKYKSQSRSAIAIVRGAPRFSRIVKSWGLADIIIEQDELDIRVWENKIELKTIVKKKSPKIKNSFYKKIILAQRELSYKLYEDIDVRPSRLRRIAKSKNSKEHILWAKRIYNFLDQLLISNNCKFVFTYAAADSWSFCISEICKKRYIKYYCLDATRVGSKYFLSNDCYSDDKEIRGKAYQIKLQDCSNEAIKYVDDFYKNPSIPAYEIENRKSTALDFKTALIEILKSFGCLLKTEKIITRFDLSSHHIIYARCILRSFLTKKYFEEVNKDDKYFLFCLHVQPEKSTNIDAPKYIDQIKVIKEICSYLPNNIYLYVKEHFHMDGKRRSSFFEKLIKIKNVKLISPYANQFQLLRNSEGVITITGTIGLESAFIGKPFYCYGESIFSNMCGIIDDNEIEIFIKNCLIGKYKEDKFIIKLRNRSKCLVESIIRNSFELDADLIWAYHSNNKKIKHRLEKTSRLILNKICY